MSDPRFSLIVPIYNEEDNVVPLIEEVQQVLTSEGPFELVLVDDASSDESVARIQAWKAEHGATWLRLVQMDQNGGQSAAVLAGVRFAMATIVCTMDGDLQNDPRDLPGMVAKIESGEADGVTGIRANRRDNAVRRLSSRIGNGVRNWVTGDQIADSGCGIKAYRREHFLAVPRFHGMHRFMATLVRALGARVCEVEVNHRPRVAGEAKYGIGNRALRGLRDCFAVRWLRQRTLRSAASEASL